MNLINQIICGNCLEIMKDIPDNSIDLVVTDPPFNVSQEGLTIPRSNMKSGIHRRDTSIKLDFGTWDKMEDKDFFDFTEIWVSECVRVLKEGSWFYSFFDKQKLGYFDLFFAPKYGLKPRTIFVWCKTNPTPQFRKVNWLSATEFIWVGSKGKSKIKNFLYQKEMKSFFVCPNASVWKETDHPTEKPIKLIERIIRASSNEGDLVLDPFLGSGTTAIVCKRLNRKFIGIEISPKYCKLANERVEKVPKRLDKFLNTFSKI